MNGCESIKIYKIYFRFFVWCHPNIDDKFRVVLPSKNISGSCILRSCVSRKTSTTDVNLAFLFSANYGFRLSRKVSGDNKGSSYLWKQMMAGISKPYNILYKLKIQVARTWDKRLSSYKRICVDEKNLHFSFIAFVNMNRTHVLLTQIFKA